MVSEFVHPSATLQELASLPVLFWEANSFLHTPHLFLTESLLNSFVVDVQACVVIPKRQ
jgi:hypothetical protein